MCYCSTIFTRSFPPFSGCGSLMELLKPKAPKKYCYETLTALAPRWYQSLIFIKSPFPPFAFLWCLRLVFPLWSKYQGAWTMYWGMWGLMAFPSSSTAAGTMPAFLASSNSLCFYFIVSSKCDELCKKLFLVFSHWMDEHWISTPPINSEASSPPQLIINF